MSKRIKNLSIPVLFFLCTLTIILSSCAAKPIGYGVLLWWDEKAELTAGEIYPVYSESNIRDSYILVPEGERGEEVPRWRMDFFEKENDALAFAESYTPTLRVFGDTLQNGLAIRSEPTTDSNRIYKLRAGQTVKIVEKLPEAKTIGGKEGYWYRVLTGDGSEGYTFGANLDIYDADIRASQADQVEVAPILENFLSLNFRPDEFRKMVRERRIDLRRFSAEQGIFPNIENKTIRVVTAEESFTFTFDKISLADKNHYIFEGSDLDVTMITPNRAAVHYKNKGEDVNQVYVALEGMTEIIEQELARRDELFASLKRMGSGSSNAYGTIAFEDLNIFTWEGFERLVPSTIPGSARGQGTVDLWYFPVADLTGDYEGVFTFHFSPYSPGSDRDINFLFKRTEQGLRLVYVPKKDIKEELVQKVSSSPLVMFFAAANTPYIDPPPAEETEGE